MIASLRPVMPGLVLRATVLWILTRMLFVATFAFASAAAGGSAEIVPGAGPGETGWAAVLSLRPSAGLVVAVAVTALVLADVRAVRERAFLANLGVGLRSVAAVSFTVAVAWEVVMAMAL